ncbi:MAG: alpha-E domain-containing protein [Actinomycetota bacterium]
MLSRVADSIYWLSRYVERAENVARFIDVNLHLMLDLPSDTEQQWEPLINITGDREIFEDHFDDYSRENVIQFLTFDPDYPNSILGCVHRAREIARSARDVISSETWVQLNRFYLMVRNAAYSDFALMTSPHEFFTQVKIAGHTFEGIMDSTMSHGEAWHFGQIGRSLERADKTTRIIDMKYFILLPDVTYFGSPYDNIQWAALLRSASALEMYRKRFGRIVPNDVVEFLILDPEFPRSVRFCVHQAEDSLQAIAGSSPGSQPGPAQRHMGRLRAQLDFATIDEVLAAGVHEVIDGIQVELNAAGDEIYRAIYGLTSPSSNGQSQMQTQTQTAY